MAFAIAVLFAVKFRAAIHDLLGRMIEGNILGQSIKAVPPQKQRVGPGAHNEDLLNKAAAAGGATSSSPPSTTSAQLPPELQNDPRAKNAIEYVQNNPIETVVEYKKLSFAYQYERLFSRIYGTQISLLELLASKPNEEFTLPQIASFHAEHQKLAGSTDYEIGSYMKFLVLFGVVSATGHPDAQTYRISQQGVEFLSYIKANYPDSWAKRAY